MAKLVDTAAAPFHHVSPEIAPPMEAALMSCIEEQRRAHALYEPAADPEQHVSEAALHQTLREHADVSDVRTDHALSNCLVFHTSGLPGSVDDQGVIDARRGIDALVLELLVATVGGTTVAGALPSGHFWYPSGSYMGWHTNSRVPGWRAYITWVAEPHRSFFRYADPHTGVVTTSWDTGWDLRVFLVEPERPFWHAVCSHTDRFSFGYRLLEP